MIFASGLGGLMIVAFILGAIDGLFFHGNLGKFSETHSMIKQNKNINRACDNRKKNDLCSKLIDIKTVRDYTNCNYNHHNNISSKDDDLDIAFVTYLNNKHDRG